MATTTTDPSGTTTTTLATTTSVGAATTLPGGPTTTLPTTTTSSPLLAITELSSVCINDTPWIEIRFGDQPVYDGMPATIHFFDMTGKPVAEPIVTTYRAGTTVRVLYPGAAVDPMTGEPTDWPGWRQLPDGRWVEDPTDSLLRARPARHRGREPARRGSGDLPARYADVRRRSAPAPHLEPPRADHDNAHRDPGGHR